MENTAKTLKIKNLDDWYNFTAKVGIFNFKIK